MNTLKTIGIFLAVLTVMWLLAGFGLIATWLAWLTGLVVIVAVAAGLIRYFTWKDNPAAVPPHTPRANLITTICQYRWIWVLPIALAVLTTVAIALASYAGIVIPVLNWGGRNTPWLYLYFWQLVFWSGVIVIGVCFFNRPIALKLVRAIGYWVQRGGFWHFWSEDNLPAKSLLIGWVILLFVTIIAGPPTPKIDPKMVAWQAQEQVSAVINKPAVKDAEVGLGNYLAKAFIGRELFSNTSTEVKLMGEPKVRYHRGWTWFFLTVFTFPLCIFGLIYSHRDEAADLFDRLIARIQGSKEKREESRKVAAGSEGARTPAEKPTEKVVSHDTAFSKLLASDLLSDALVATLSRWSNSLRKTA